jgi:hypothetical protein
MNRRRPSSTGLLAEKSENWHSSLSPTDPHGDREQDYAKPVQS